MQKQCGFDANAMRSHCDCITIALRAYFLPLKSVLFLGSKKHLDLYKGQDFFCEARFFFKIQFFTLLHFSYLRFKNMRTQCERITFLCDRYARKERKGKERK
jgi:hypothetical protein